MFVSEDNYKFAVQNLTALGYEYVEAISDDKDWNKILKDMKNKGLSPTWKNIGEFLGIIGATIINIIKD